MKITKKEVEEAMEELKQAYFEGLALDQEETKIQLKRTANRHRILLAKATANSFKFN